MVPDRSNNRSRPAELESCYARAAGAFSYCDARKLLCHAPPCEPEFFTGLVHWQCHQRRIDDLADDAGIHQGAGLVALPEAGCAEKRAFERHTPCLRILRVIGCNLLEICVTYEDAAHPSVPLLRENNTPHFPSRTNPQKPTTNHKLREHTKSRPRKIPAPRLRKARPWTLTRCRKPAKASSPRRAMRTSPN